ncbi:MFS transporter, partial [Micromonospora aurantiaca]|nr:MFS transporter [Micromonospora aurantiaca]
MAGGRSRRGWLPAAYARCLADREFRRMQPGFLISFLGDGMSMVGVAWLALQLAGPGDRAAVVGMAVAAY